MDLTNVNKDRKPKRRSSLIGNDGVGESAASGKTLEEAVLGAIMLEKMLSTPLSKF
jgi:hypothetical protein